MKIENSEFTGRGRKIPFSDHAVIKRSIGDSGPPADSFSHVL